MRDRFFPSIDPDYLTESGVPSKTVDMFQTTGSVPAQGPGRRKLVRRLSRLSAGQPPPTVDIREAEDQVIEMVSNQERRDEMSYTGISDPDVRTSLKLGEMLMGAAIQRGIHIPDSMRNEDWLSMSAPNVFRHLVDYNGKTEARSALKQVRAFVKRSGLNGDKSRILDQVSSLMESLKPPVVTSRLPELPVRVANSPSKG